MSLNGERDSNGIIAVGVRDRVAGYSDQE